MSRINEQCVQLVYLFLAFIVLCKIFTTAASISTKFLLFLDLSGHESAADQFLNHKPVCVTTANASPLQRLKALTHSDIVNHSVEPPLTKNSAVFRAGVALPLSAVKQSTNGLLFSGSLSTVQRKQTSPESVSPSQLSVS